MAEALLDFPDNSFRRGTMFFRSGRRGEEHEYATGASACAAIRATPPSSVTNDRSTGGKVLEQHCIHEALPFLIGEPTRWIVRVGSIHIQVQA
jgi:hypothetical protein